MSNTIKDQIEGVKFLNSIGDNVNRKEEFEIPKGYVDGIDNILEGKKQEYLNPIYKDFNDIPNNYLEELKKYEI